jgi:hypothetical protein
LDAALQLHCCTVSCYDVLLLELPINVGVLLLLLLLHDSAFHRCCCCVALLPYTLLLLLCSPSDGP